MCDACANVLLSLCLQVLPACHLGVTWDPGRVREAVSECVAGLKLPKLPKLPPLALPDLPKLPKLPKLAVMPASVRGRRGWCGCFQVTIHARHHGVLFSILAFAGVSARTLARTVAACRGARLYSARGSLALSAL